MSFRNTNFSFGLAKYANWNITVTGIPLLGVPSVGIAIFWPSSPRRTAIVPLVSITGWLYGRAARHGSSNLVRSGRKYPY